MDSTKAGILAAGASSLSPPSFLFLFCMMMMVLTQSLFPCSQQSTLDEQGREQSLKRQPNLRISTQSSPDVPTASNNSLSPSYAPSLEIMTCSGPHSTCMRSFPFYITHSTHFIPSHLSAPFSKSLPVQYHLLNIQLDLLSTSAPPDA